MTMSNENLEVLLHSAIITLSIQSSDERRGNNGMTTYYIYGLVDPTNENLRYVGMSKYPENRMHQHLCHARRNGSRMASSPWIAGLLARNLRPAMIILEAYEADSKSDAMDVERQWIMHHLFGGADLLNRHARHAYRRRSRILPGREPTLRLDKIRGWYYVND